MRKPVLALIFGLSLLYISTNVHAASLDFVPASQNIVQGNPLTIGLVISGLGNMALPSLSAFDVDIAFDPAILAFTGATFGDAVLGDQLDLFGLGSLLSADLIIPGLVNLFELSFDFPDDLDAFQPDNFTLAVLTFDAIAQGQSALSLTINVLGDANGDPLSATVGSVGEITVTPPSPTGIPEPSTIALLVTGCLGLLVYRRMRPLREQHGTE